MIGSTQAELRVLAAALASRRARAVALAALTPADFLDAAHREVWSIIAELARAGKPVSLEAVKDLVIGRGLAWAERLEAEALALIDPAPLVELVKQYSTARSWHRLAAGEIRRRVPGLPPQVLKLTDELFERALAEPAIAQVQTKIRKLIDDVAAVASEAIKTDRTQGRAAAVEKAAQDLAPVEAAAKSTTGPAGPAGSEATWNRNWSHAQPVWFGRIGNFEFRREAPIVYIHTGRNQPAARAWISLNNFRRELEGKIKIGDPVLWQWGYADRPGPLVTIFEGFVVNVIEAADLAVEAYDQMFRVWQAPRTKSFNRATAGQILSWFLDQAAMPGKVIQGGRLEHFPANKINASAVAQRLVDSLTNKDGIDRSDWAHFIDRSGRFVWGPYESHGHQRLAVPPEFRLAHNVINYRPARRPGRLTWMKTLAVPEVRHSMDIKVRRKIYRTERVGYFQRPGSLRMEIKFR